MSQSLEDTVAAYFAAWNRMDFDALAALWDTSETELYYVAEEVEQPLHRFEDIRKYWTATGATVEWVRIETSDHRYRLISDTLAIVSYEMHVDASMRGYTEQGFKPVGSDVRTSGVLRETDGDWRFIHYVEAALGALPFVRRVYNANVRDR